MPKESQLSIYQVRVLHKEASLTEMVLDLLMSLKSQLMAFASLKLVCQLQTSSELVMGIHILVTASALQLYPEIVTSKNAVAR